MLWFTEFSVCFKLIIIHYHTQKQRKIKFEPRIKLNYNMYTKKMQGTSGILLKTSNGILQFLRFDWLTGNGI